MSDLPMQDCEALVPGAEAERPPLGQAEGRPDWDDLVEACDPASLLLIIERRLGPALRVRHAPEDVLQEALLAAWRAWSTIDWRGVQPFRLWLLTVIDHRVRDLADRESARKRGGGVEHTSLDATADGDGREAPPQGWPTRSTTPSRIALHRERAEAIRAALDAVPEDDAMILRLRLLDLMSIDSIATHLGVGVDAVRHRFRRGAERFHRELSSRLPGQRVAPIA